MLCVFEFNVTYVSLDVIQAYQDSMTIFLSKDATKSKTMMKIKFNNVFE